MLISGVSVDPLVRGYVSQPEYLVLIGRSLVTQGCGGCHEAVTYFPYRQHRVQVWVTICLMRLVPLCARTFIIDPCMVHLPGSNYPLFNNTSRETVAVEKSK